jgi:predicted site-specific integrase-resolvase
MDDDAKKYLTPDEAARLIGAASQTLARWRCEGGGPQFIRVGRKIMYGADDISVWMNSRRVSSTSEAAKAA